MIYRQLTAHKQLLLALLVPVIYLVISLITIKDYGINWDEPVHFAKGQAALHFILTGKSNYLDLPAYFPKPKGDSDFMDQYGQDGIQYINAVKSKEVPNSRIRRSYYQSDVWTYDYWISQEGVNHPQVNDLLAAFSNYVFYQKLGIMGDIASYHFFEVVVSFFIVLAVSLLVCSKFGLIPSIFSSISIAFYPLFFSESHFNIKDPVVCSFMGLIIIFFYWGVTSVDWKKILLSSIIFGISLGTKFNTLFVIPILGLWPLYYLFIQNREKERVNIFKSIFKNKPFLVSSILFPVVSILVFVALSPTLWTDVIHRLPMIVLYYKEIGVGVPAELTRFVFTGFNSFPSFWFLITTPIAFLILFFVGIVVSFYKIIRKRDGFPFLAVLWFLVPFIRVSFFNTNIYGGIRQIMEFLPGMAVLVGIGISFLLSKTRYKKIVLLLLVVAFGFTAFEVYRTHPNENVYFNQFIGGLSGAKKRNVPYWGNSYGNPYLQGVEWLNKNVEVGAKVALPINTPYFIPRTKLRPDIYFSNAYLSGDKHAGEYVMEHYFDWYPEKWYRYAYYDTFLNPVYEVKVDGVAIFKIWKNSSEFVRPEYKETTRYYSRNIKIENTEIDKGTMTKRLTVDLGKEVLLTKIKINHSAYRCDKQTSGYGYIATSEDGKIWSREPEDLLTPQIRFGANEFDDTNFTFLFAAKKARYIMLDSQEANSCLLKRPSVLIEGIK